ncbi:MAG TPA: alpha/beta hydrolase [Vicinamibacterales bacterium]|jgi:acetyl esterase/lipase|nr:alpha/beta hydrolase [Vicinamibacterales bacterium]
MKKTVGKLTRMSFVAVFVAASFAPAAAYAQSADALTRSIHVLDNYRIVPNITYLTANNWDAKLDVYQARGAATPNQTLIYVHGGGWTGGTKESSSLTFLPFLEMGWNVVNVEYRLAKISQAPAAVEDCLCALRWVYQRARDYNIDTSRLVTMGNSAGGHLALMMGMVPSGAGLDRQCPGTEELKVAAVINWYGITDVNDLLAGPNMKTYAVTWLGSVTNRDEVARRVSPLTYVRAGIPPVITIQGDADPTVPYAHGIRLQQALDKAGVPNQHVTIPGGKHGGFTDAEMAKAYAAILSFLEKQNVVKQRTNN